uniref:Cryptogene protein G1(ND9) n=1 Tax=Leishmania tarentolae TaxID=5689 RepID=Q7M450_LEITA
MSIKYNMFLFLIMFRCVFVLLLFFCLCCRWVFLCFVDCSFVFFYLFVCFFLFFVMFLFFNLWFFLLYCLDLFCIDFCGFCFVRFILIYVLFCLLLCFRVSFVLICFFLFFGLVFSLFFCSYALCIFEREVFDLFGFVFCGNDCLHRFYVDWFFVGFFLCKVYPLFGLFMLNFCMLCEDIVVIATSCFVLCFSNFAI